MGTEPRNATPSSPDPASPMAPDLKRRRFLLAIGAGGAAVATAAANAEPLAARVDPDATQPEDTASTYRVTEHVRDYYRSTKL